jgi:hypothetical protein
MLTMTLLRSWRNLTCRRIVADRKWEGHAGIAVLETIADHRGAAYAISVFPYNLREVTPAIEVIHIGSGLAVAHEVAEFIIVHQICNHHSNLVPRDTKANVLAISATINRTIGWLDYPFIHGTLWNWGVAHVSW